MSWGVLLFKRRARKRREWTGAAVGLCERWWSHKTGYGCVVRRLLCLRDGVGVVPRARFALVENMVCSLRYEDVAEAGAQRNTAALVVNVQQCTEHQARSDVVV